MSKQWIEKYFLNIGLSFYQSDEIMRVNRDAKIQFSFISQFGIGFLSSFLVAQQVVIKTRQAQSDGFIITIAHIDDYFDVRAVKEKIPVGTEVTVMFKRKSAAVLSQPGIPGLSENQCALFADCFKFCG